MIVKSRNPSIICITEVKPKNYRYVLSEAEITLDGYQLYGTNITNHVGRGVVIYVTDTLHANPVEFKTNFQESTWISTRLAGGDNLIIV